MDEIKKIITIETDQAVNSLGKIEGSVQDINKEFKNLDKASVTLKDITKDEKNLGNIIRTNTKDIRDNSGEFTKGLDDIGKGLDQVIPGTSKVTRGIGDVIKGLKALKAASLSNPWTAILTVAVTATAAIAANWKNIAKWIGIAKRDSMDVDFTKFVNTNEDIVNLQRQQAILEEIVNIAGRFKDLDIVSPKVGRLFNTLSKPVSRITGDPVETLTKEEKKRLDGLLVTLEALGGINLGLPRYRSNLKGYEEQLKAVIAQILKLQSATDTPTPETTTETAETGSTRLPRPENLQDVSPETKQYVNGELLKVKATVQANTQILASDEFLKTKRQQFLEEYREALEKSLEYIPIYSQSISNLMGTVADAEEEIIQARINNGKITEEQAEKEFKTVKGFRIAEASMTMLQGIVEAMSTAMTLGPVAGPIVGALNAATVGAAGIAQITRIKNTTFGSGATSAATLPTTSAINTAYTSTQGSSLTDRTNVDTLNNLSNQIRDTRVYVVESDIRQAGKRADVINQETTF